MNEKGIAAAALAIRSLTMDAVQKANSGHPGLPMGCAELGALIFGEFLSHFPADPTWINRDRFVLSAGHGSMLLYSLLHLCGYDLSLEDIKDFRQLGSRTPGHPEYGLTPGVETTTGPLGQGIGNGVGMAIAERMLAARFNTEAYPLIDHYTFVLAGDGDLMEGVASEACSLAGHLGLGKLIVFYDSNRITIEGSTELAFSEEVRRRFEGYHWQVLKGDAYDLRGIQRLVRRAKKEGERPTLIELSSIIAKGSPRLAGSHEAHGAPLGEEEVRQAKRALGLREDEFFQVPQEARDYFKAKRRRWARAYRSWQKLFQAWSKENPDLYRQWQSFFAAPSWDPARLPAYKPGDKLATRKASGETLNALAAQVPNLVGGSADLAPSNSTLMKGLGDFQKGDPGGRNLHFGVREHAMGAISNGILLHGGLRPFCATFLVFADYMRPSIRLAALMKLPVIYVFTHDSIYVGEDGPTHQPVEQMASLRAIPGLMVLRPGDGEETVAAWELALARLEGPTALLLTRQNLTVYPKPAGWRETLPQGAYTAADCEGSPELVLVATGSEVNLALEVQKLLAQKRVRVVSMICRELFTRQGEQMRRELIPDGCIPVVLEAGVSQGWGEISGGRERIFCLDRFGESGPAAKVAEHLGFSAGEIAAKLGAAR